ncbi:MAG: phage tail protein [Lachnospiraceae bacterium]|nr:phage tail protein [Lachnospiraceae bacterium]
MGINLKQLKSAIDITNSFIKNKVTELTNFIQDEDVKIDQQVTSKIQALANTYEGEQNTFQLLDQQVGIQDSPVGTILTFMGTKAPSHYFICDGTEYEIAKYPLLAKHFELQFGSVNHFGGDGVATFAVPDLRGEFLRMTGNNGGDVGEHQKPTNVNNVRTNSNCLLAYAIETDSGTGRPAADAYPVVSTRMYNIRPDAINAAEIGSAVVLTPRPTNTSVLYCIKYEPSYYMTVGPQTYRFSQEEIPIGTWIDGKTIYRKVLIGHGGNMGSFPTDVPDIKRVVNIFGFLVDGTDDDGPTIPFGFNNGSNRITVLHSVTSNAIQVRSNIYTSNNPIYIVFDYTKK